MSERRPKFRRVPVDAITLTKRDLDILQFVHSYRFVRSTHLTALTQASYKPLMRRLSLLYHSQYLDRPRAQLDAYGVAGSAPMIYGLGNRGADMLAEIAGVRRSKVDWTAKNREAGRLFIEHSLLIADVMISLEIACRDRDDVRLIDGSALLRDFPTATQRARNPFLMSVRVSHDGNSADIGLVPDRVFALEFPQDAQRAYFFLEADRATMPVMRPSLGQSSIFRKLLAYREAWRRELTLQCFGFKAFRALFVTSSAERAQTMFEANRAATDGQGSRLFLFSAVDAVTTDDPLAILLLNGRGEYTRLVD